LCAIPVFPLPLVFLIDGMHFSVLAAVMVAVAHTLLWWAFNRWAVLWMAEKASRPGYPGGAPSLPGLRCGLAVAVAVAVGLLAPFWWFDEAVAGVQATERVNLVDQERNLRIEDGGCRAVLDRPAPTVDADPDVVALRTALEVGNEELSAARADLRCELDGSCGSKRDGAGSIYRKKRELLDELENRVEVELPKQIADRIGVVREQIEADKKAKVEAGNRRAEIQRELASLPPVPTQWDALNRVAKPRWMEAFGVVLAAIVLYLIVDLTILRIAVRRICSFREPNRRRWPKRRTETGER
jgi:hypothetical protein